MSSGSTGSVRIPSTVGVESRRPRGASGAEVIASVPARACSRTVPSPSRAERLGEGQCVGCGVGIREQQVIRHPP